MINLIFLNSIKKIFSIIPRKQKNFKLTLPLFEKKQVRKNVKKLFKMAEDFEISPTTINLFFECQRCFYLHCKFGLRRPQGFPLVLNIAIDGLLKREFETYQSQNLPHPIFLKNNLSYMSTNVSGPLKYRFNQSNIIVTGKIDALWKNIKTNEIIIADYKATAKTEVITPNTKLPEIFERQLEIYQWLYRQLGYQVSDRAYIVYCNGKKDAEMFNNQIKFDITLVPHKGNTSWIEEKLDEIKKCLIQNRIPESSDACTHCSYLKNINFALNTEI